MFGLHNPVRFIDPSGLYVIDLGRGWSARIEQHGTGDGYRKHVHVYNNRNHWSQNDDGSPHDQGRNSPGNPPNRVLRDLKNKTGWDWKGKQESWLNQIIMEPYGETNTGWLITFPCGRTAFRGQNMFGLNVRPPNTNALIRLYLEAVRADSSTGVPGSLDPIIPIIPNPVPMPIPVPKPIPIPIPIPIFAHTHPMVMQGLRL